MNNKLEELILTKDFDHLSSHDQLFVTEFMTELDYGVYRQLLMRSKQVFQSDKVHLKEPNLNKKALLEIYRKKYNRTQSHPVSKRKNGFYYLTDLRVSGIAAVFILGIFIFNFNDNLKPSNADPSVVTEYLMRGKELPNIRGANLDINSRNMNSDLWIKKIDSFINDSKTMNDYMTIDTYGLEVAPIFSNE